MKNNRIAIFRQVVILSVGAIILISSCNRSSDSSVTLTPTIPGGSGGQFPQTASICERLSGTVEMQVLVGPAEVVGLEPIAIGSIPFSVVSDGEVNRIEGAGSISYQDVLEEVWGTYTVNFDLVADVSGECVGDEQSGRLNMTVNTSGEQVVEVRSEGFQGDYPWSGSHEYNLSFPIVEGALAEGEGWAFVLHLNE